MRMRNSTYKKWRPIRDQITAVLEILFFHSTCEDIISTLVDQYCTMYATRMVLE